ncbi:MAG: RsmE family RNA methyltransferase [Chitinophagaceae bacterium]
MRDIPLFYEENISGQNGMVMLSGESSHHIHQVLRLKAGDEIAITNGKGILMLGVLTIVDRKKSIFKITVEEIVPHPENKITICFCIIKNTSRFEWFLEKAVEIGISEIIPVISKRTEKKNVRMDRMKQIMVAALLQSKQCWLPVFNEPILFSQAILQDGFDYKFIAHCIESEKSHLKNFTLSGKVQMLIGPEGDFTNAEIETALSKGFIPVSLGKNRLRSETAAIVALTLLNN